MSNQVDLDHIVLSVDISDTRKVRAVARRLAVFCMAQGIYEGREEEYHLVFYRRSAWQRAKALHNSPCFQQAFLAHLHERAPAYYTFTFGLEFKIPEASGGYRIHARRDAIPLSEEQQLHKEHQDPEPTS